MRVVILIFMMVAIAGTASAQSGPGPTEPDYLYAATVGRVINGDTLEIDIDLGFDTRLTKQRIRFAGVQAPLLHGRTQPAGIAARDFLRGLIAGKAVIVRPLVGPQGKDIKDESGHWIGHVYLNGLDVGQHMIVSGFADKADQ